MEGGIFGLSILQKSVLYSYQLVPAIIAFLVSDIIESMFMIQIFYAASSYLYINFLSI